MNEGLLIEFARQMNEAAAALIKCEGMKAENKQREIQGDSPSYGEEAFIKLLESSGLGYNDLISKNIEMIK